MGADIGKIGYGSPAGSPVSRTSQRCSAGIVQFIREIDLKSYRPYSYYGIKISPTSRFAVPTIRRLVGSVFNVQVSVGKC